MAKEPTFKPLDFCEHTIAFKHFIEVQWIEFAGQLKEIRDKGLYEGRWENFEDFLLDPAMAMDKGTASKMITIFEKFVLEYKIQNSKIAQVGGWSKVAEILPVVKNKATAEKWLDEAAALSKSDLRKQVQEKRDGKGIECKHTKTHKIVLEICDNCGEKWRDDEDHKH